MIIIVLTFFFIKLTKNKRFAYQNKCIIFLLQCDCKFATVYHNLAKHWPQSCINLGTIEPHNCCNVIKKSTPENWVFRIYMYAEYFKIIYSLKVWAKFDNGFKRCDVLKVMIDSLNVLELATVLENWAGMTSHMPAKLPI